MSINVHSPLRDNLLTKEEMKLLLEQPDCKNSMGLRDRTMMEVLYWTGMRGCELVNLTLDNIDRVNELLTIRSKNVGNRQVPLRKHLIEYLDRYVHEARPNFFGSEKANILFISYHGRALNNSELWRIIKRYVKSSNIQKPVTTHNIRHAALRHHFIEKGDEI